MGLQHRTGVLFITSAIAMLTGPTLIQAGCCCPTFWTGFKQHCYRFFSYNMTWNQAEQFCQSYTVPSLGDGSAVRDSMGHLISIHSQAEQNFAITLYETSRKKEVDEDGRDRAGLWLGFNDLSSEGDHVWTDGTPMDFTNWLPGQPDNSGQVEHCAVTRSVENGKWRDAPCIMSEPYHVYYLICKLPMW